MYIVVQYSTFYLSFSSGLAQAKPSSKNMNHQERTHKAATLKASCDNYNMDASLDEVFRELDLSDESEDGDGAER